MAENQTDHHIAIYNNKTVIMDYIDNPKEEFKYACFRVRDNLKTGTVGYVITPKGKKYLISRESRKAKLITEKDIKDD